MITRDEVQGDVAILEITGKIMGGDEVMIFHSRIREHLEAGKKHFVINLCKVEWTNSLGLGMLIAAMTSVKRGDGRLVLACYKSIEDLLNMTRLITIFETYDTLDDAIESFKGTTS